MTARMISRLAGLLLPLNRRERLLLAALLLAVLPLGAGFALLLPLHERRLAAEQAQAEAAALQAWAAGRLAEKQTLARSAPPAPGAPAGLSGIEQRLIAAGLRRRLSGLGSGPGETVELRFDSIGFEELGAFLMGAHPAWGYRLRSFRFEAQEAPGRVAAWITLAPQQ
ncbi:type II secretion system protein GspM [Leisingera sp. NJS204]|uniref:type II secretion system protein GspM n=1 Tax=Leisingera sp. NJS204 TaxID=2508307 RepID=UPI00101014B5|nr:type II secretion system protein GspM [Leisingera sp. NJS204]QAX32071.1 hypothetical protein ETW24_22025 [Leisingera sp. NJS204]